VTIPSALECLWPWLMTDIAAKAAYYPIGGSKRTFFCMLLFAVLCGVIAQVGMGALRAACYEGESLPEETSSYASDTTEESWSDSDGCTALRGVWSALSLLSSAASLLLCFVLFLLRQRIRRLRNISPTTGQCPSGVEDALLSCACPCCALMQLGREVDSGDSVTYCSVPAPSYETVLAPPSSQQVIRDGALCVGDVL
jgi:hypothetical protein